MTAMLATPRIETALDLSITGIFNAPRHRVFQAWIQPESMARWLSPFADATAIVDPRVGGAFRVVMRGLGREIEHTGDQWTYRTRRRYA